MENYKRLFYFVGQFIIVEIVKTFYVACQDIVSRAYLTEGWGR